MKKIFFAAAVIFLCTAAAAQPAGNKLSLQQCVEMAIKNNLQSEQSSLLAQQNEIQFRQAKLNMLPNLNGSISQGINKGRSIDPYTNAYIDSRVDYGNYGLSSGIVLFNGFSLQNTVKQNRLNYEASKMEWQQVKDNLTLSTILAYLQVLTNEDVLTQSQQQAALTKKQVERLEILNSEGAIQPSQLSDLQGQYAGDQLAIINAQNALETSTLSLCQLMNISYDKNLSVEKINTGIAIENYAETAGNIYQTALKNFAQIKAVDLRVAGSEKAVKAARGRLYPTMSFGYNVNTNYSSAASLNTFINTSDVISNDYVTVAGEQYAVTKQVDNFETAKIAFDKQLKGNVFSSFGVSLSIPLFNSLQQRNLVKLAKLDVKNNEAVARTAKTQLEQAIDLAYINMGSSLERYNTLQEQVNAFTESFREAEIRFNNGVGNSIDYLTAKNNLDKANINFIVAKYDFVLRTKALDYYQGKALW